MNTIAATSQRIPRPALIGIAVLIIAFVAVMVVRLGASDGSESGTSAVTPKPARVTPTTTKAVTTTPKVVLLPGLPAGVSHALRYSKVAVVSIYVGKAPGDRAAVAEARRGARSAGAGFAAVNVDNDKQAASVSSFAGDLSTPSMIVVRRPGNIVATFTGPVESAVAAQAAHNAGARR